MLRTPTKSLLLLATAVAAGSAAWPLAAPAGPPVPQELRSYLEKAQFAPDRLAALEAGQVIARTVADNDGEMAAIGAVRIRTTRAHVELYFEQLASYEDGVVVLQVGRFGNPARVADLERLALEREDIDTLRDCRPGDCEVNVGTGFADLRAAINWKAPDYASQVERFVKERLVAYVNAYRDRGDAGLLVYDNTSKPVSLRDEWLRIVAHSPRVFEYAPALRQYLEKYPGAAPPGVKDYLYWSKENQGLKPIVSVTHAIVHRDPSKPDRTSLVQKQIFASRYYEASLALTTVVDAGQENGRPAVYLAYFNRSRTGLLRGFGGGVKRKIAQSEIVKGTEYTLGSIRDALEKAAGIR